MRSARVSTSGSACARRTLTATSAPTMPIKTPNTNSPVVPFTKWVYPKKRKDLGEFAEVFQFPSRLPLLGLERQHRRCNLRTLRECG